MQPSGTEFILTRVIGEDRPGLAVSVIEILAKYDAVILDTGWADIHNTLSLGILCKTERQHSGFIMKELLFKASPLGITIRFYPITAKEYENWVGMQGKNRYILTLLRHKLSARQISAVTRILVGQGMSIDAIKRLTGRIPLDEYDAKTRVCIGFSMRGTPKDRTVMQEELMRLTSELGIDFSFQSDNVYRRTCRLIYLDMGSTLIETETIDELALRAGISEQVKAITERAMRGEIDFTEGFREQVALSKGLDESVIQEIAEELPITEGVDRLMYVLKKYGYKITILLDGFIYFGHYLQQKYDIDCVHANRLETENGKLIGRYPGDVADDKHKAELLRLITQVEKTDIAQTIAVGDRANDLPMLDIAGLGTAFHAKPKVVANAKQPVDIIGLDGVLYFLGSKDPYVGIPRQNISSYNKFVSFCGN